MRIETTRSRSAAVAVFGLVLAAGSAASAAVAPIGDLVVFGDSLSDTGNILAFTSTPLAQSFGYTPRPTVPFYKAGQFTNGEGGNAGLPATAFTNGVWIRTLADTLGRTRPASVGLDPANNPQGTNYAWGGAQASATGGSLLLPSVGQQVNSYINGRGNIPNNPLYVFWAGGNDLLNAATAAGATPASINAAKDNAIAALKSSIQRLFDRIDPNQPAQVLWANLPSLDRVPAAAALPANLRTALRDASAAFALEQGQAITDLVEPVANRYIYGLDIYGLFNQILDNPAAYGFANTTNPVIVTPDFARPGPFNPTLAVPPGTNPDGFVFWDPIHPTSHVHALIGNAAAAVIPAPGVGVFAAVGLLAARRRRVAV